MNKKKNIVNKKIFDYKVIIISLYGTFESFCENLIKSYIDQLNGLIKDYNSLPEKILKNHTKLSSELILKLEYPKYQDLKEEDIILNLHSCIINKDYKLNSEAYAQHTANFKHDIVNSKFSDLGISRKIKENKKFKEFFTNMYPDLDYDHSKDQILFEKINDLALRRNEIAHGSDSINILSNDILREYINFIEIYSEALYENVFYETLQYEVEYNSIKLTKVIPVINNKIICATIDNYTLSLGDLIISEVCISEETKNYYIGEVVEIRSEDKSFVSICGNNLEVGIKVNYHIKDNYNFFLKKKLSRH